jgi:uncharacterized protein YndB with AHSA1/START domain
VAGSVTVSRHARVPPERIWACLADPYSFARWVAGTFRIRSADASWPAPGAELHHSWGIWPVQVRDRTTVIAADPPRRLVLEARARPVGAVRAEIRVLTEPGGARVVLCEDLVEGWGARWPGLGRIVQYLRNRRSVRRLAVLAECSQNDAPRTRSATRARRR